MARLTTAQRKRLPKRDFALPSGTKRSKKPAFPVEDKTHARAALRMAPRAEHAGNITKSQERTVQRKARAKLGGSSKRTRRR